jgi:hypothetical protein
MKPISAMLKKSISFVMIFALLMNSAIAATFTVDDANDTSDVAAGDGTCLDGGGIVL